MQDSQLAPLQVLDASMRIDQLRFADQRHRHRVDREVAAGEVLGQRRRANLGKRSGMSVSLRTGGGQVDLEAVDPHGRRAEALVRTHLPTEPPGHLANLALDRDVDVRPLPAKQQIAHGAANQIRGDLCRRLAQALDPGKRRQALRKSLGLDLGVWGRHRALFMGPSDPFPTMTAFADGSPARHRIWRSWSVRRRLAVAGEPSWWWLAWRSACTWSPSAPGTFPIPTPPFTSRNRWRSRRWTGRCTGATPSARATCRARSWTPPSAPRCGASRRASCSSSSRSWSRTGSTSWTRTEPFARSTRTRARSSGSGRSGR